MCDPFAMESEGPRISFAGEDRPILDSTNASYMLLDQCTHEVSAHGSIAMKGSSWSSCGLAPLLRIIPRFLPVATTFQ
jgi:hypothetical protein